MRLWRFWDLALPLRNSGHNVAGQIQEFVARYSRANYHTPLLNQPQIGRVLNAEGGSVLVEEAPSRLVGRVTGIFAPGWTRRKVISPVLFDTRVVGDAQAPPESSPRGRFWHALASPGSRSLQRSARPEREPRGTGDGMVSCCWPGRFGGIPVTGAVVTRSDR